MTTDEQAREDQQTKECQAVKPNFDTFRQLFPSKPMNALANRHKNDCSLLNPEQGLIEIEYPASAQIKITEFDADNNLDFVSGRYLWAIRHDDGVHALEILGKSLDVGGGSLKHSNLTGGKEAHGGGELWYWKDANTVIVNAHSGRYGNHGAGGVEMAQALVDALRKCGFNAATTGIEEETDTLRAYPDPEARLEFK